MAEIENAYLYANDMSFDSLHYIWINEFEPYIEARSYFNTDYSA